MDYRVMRTDYPLSFNLAGKTFGRLTVVSYERPGWKCRCSCGVEKVVGGYDLRSGKVKSCGCLNMDMGRIAHENSVQRFPEYLVWKNMKSRCYNPKMAQYKDYGGRGITVCERWRNSFKDFLSDMGHRPSDQHSLHRKDNDAPYGPENCCWATKKTQMYCRRKTRYFEYQGRKLSLLDARELIPKEQQADVPDYALGFRIFKAKWDPIKALTTPLCRGRRPKFDHGYAPGSRRRPIG